MCLPDFRVSSEPETVRVYPLSSLSPPALLHLSSCRTGNILRCDVIINQTESIQVVTAVRQLFTDDPPLPLSVRAVRKVGNTFSCLAGLEFNWRLAKEPDATQAVRFVRQHDAGYAPPPHILFLEATGQRGESVLLYGIHSGSALIKVSFLPLNVRLHLSPVGDAFPAAGIHHQIHSGKQQEGETEVNLSEEG
ncbi:nuclear pore membrane glycoprotein 210-like [Puntigrus tetrazona]|uniref:nuclear pore membrane glycoprotein 210-like n=1 Tax=Puntigrus tetrazona TaxID=1606681 RepID=UPI001C8A6ED1|nr:nuclear pore membrane glycoprotein 210-like [Puntigrus tetrazona]